MQIALLPIKQRSNIRVSYMNPRKENTIIMDNIEARKQSKPKLCFDFFVGYTLHTPN